ncbi:MAG: ion channel [Alphaproteobacteria bacterium]
MFKTLDQLYHGNSRRDVNFRYGLLAFDAAMIVFITVSSFYHGHIVVEILDAVFGLVVLVEFSARMTVTRNRWQELMHPAGIADIIVIVSLLAPIIGESLAFLRVARALRLFRSYQTVSRLRRDVPFFRRNQDAIFAGLNLFIFIFVMTAIVYETQYGKAPGIRNYVDALYFTVTTLTTTGFGDITLAGSFGKLLSVLIMIFGVSLFLNLIRTLFQPPRIHWRCPNCGLTRHEFDAIHCRHCGTRLNIPHADRA